MINKETVNSCDELWKRIENNQGRILSMSRHPGTISYEVINNDTVKWISQNNDQTTYLNRVKLKSVNALNQEEITLA